MTAGIPVNTVLAKWRVDERRYPRQVPSSTQRVHEVVLQTHVVAKYLLVVLMAHGTLVQQTQMEMQEQPGDGQADHVQYYHYHQTMVHTLIDT